MTLKSKQNKSIKVTNWNSSKSEKRVLPFLDIFEEKQWIELRTQINEDGTVQTVTKKITDMP